MIMIMKCQSIFTNEVCKMNTHVGIWSCQLLGQMKRPPLSWNILVARRNCCSTDMSDSTVISAK